MSSWIKMRTCLTDTSEVQKLALGFAKKRLPKASHAERACFVVGALLKTWSIWDALSHDSSIGHSPEELDASLDMEGWTQAVLDVGWLTIIENRLCMPEFENHMGWNAKRRALDQRAKAQSRWQQKREAEERVGSREDSRRSASGQVSARKPTSVRSGAVPEERRGEERKVKSFPGVSGSTGRGKAGGPAGPHDLSAPPPGNDPGDRAPVQLSLHAVRQAIERAHGSGRSVPTMDAPGARALSNALEARRARMAADIGEEAASEALIRDVARVVHFAERDHVENIAGYVISAAKGGFASLPDPSSEAAAVGRSGPVGERPEVSGGRSGWVSPEEVGALAMAQGSSKRAIEALLNEPGIRGQERARLESIQLAQNVDDAQRQATELQTMAAMRLEVAG